MTTDQHVAQAKQLMRHYFRVAYQGSGQRWDSDNAVEVGNIVDYIIDACAQPPQPDALTRIADALDRIADQLDMLSAGGVSSDGNEISFLRIDTGIA